MHEDQPAWFSARLHDHTTLAGPNRFQVWFADDGGRFLGSVLLSFESEQFACTSHIDCLMDLDCKVASSDQLVQVHGDRFCATPPFRYIRNLVHRYNSGRFLRAIL